jgi:molybdopterin synthase sulfur carrier subunit
MILWRMKTLNAPAAATLPVPVKVHITNMLVRHLNAKPDFEVRAKSIGELLDVIDREVEGFRDSICDETGRIRVYVNVFVNGENVGQDKDALSFSLGEGDEIYILASVAGGTL